MIDSETLAGAESMSSQKLNLQTLFAFIWPADGWLLLLCLNFVYFLNEFGGISQKNAIFALIKSAANTQFTALLGQAAHARLPRNDDN